MSDPTPDEGAEDYDLDPDIEPEEFATKSELSAGHPAEDGVNLP